MADLTTSYLGLSLPSPLVLASSSLSNRVENFQLAEQSGAGAVVLRSLFEEQIEAADTALQEALTYGSEITAEATRSFFPHQHIGPAEYLQLIARAKRAVRIPVIGSVNCVAPGSWSDYAKQVAEAGAVGEVRRLSSKPGTSVKSLSLEPTKKAILLANSLSNSGTRLCSGVMFFLEVFTYRLSCSPP